MEYHSNADYNSRRVGVVVVVVVVHPFCIYMILGFGIIYGLKLDFLKKNMSKIELF